MSMREHFISQSHQRVDAAPAWREYLALCKPRVVSLIVFTAVIGMFLSTDGMVPLAALLFGTAGIGLAASAGAAINHIADRRIDAVMARTRSRPLPTGRLDTMRAVLFAGALCTISMLMLVSMVNLLTAVLTFASMIGYSVVYTVFLKWRTPQNIVIGGAAGAMPPVLGWSAVTGSIDPHALLLFLIIFAWTPPHFWALAIHRKDDYARADIPMLPVTHGIAFTRTYVMLYTLVLVVVSLLPFVTRMSGVLYLAAALILGAGFLYQAVVLYRGQDERAPYRTFKYSIHYLSGLFAALLIDHYFPVLV
ncbi:MAG TPA: heme o synthase, partial [Gammaproteobacteria bacterium]|nr:heme o synthase [Gammaproteobacteria bacterium]